MNKNYITIKQLNQHPKFKEDFIKWWQPQIGDRIDVNGFESNIIDIDEYYGVKEIVYYSKFINEGTKCFKGECILLPQIHHLIQYIENKINEKVEMYYSWDYYTIAIRDTGCGGDDPQIDTGETNLLQALFQVAYKISEEE